MVALLLIRHGHDHIDLSLAGVGDKALGAVEHIVVALLHRGSLLAGRVCTGVGLGQTKGAQAFSAGQPGQVLLLLLLSAPIINGGGAQGGMGRQGDAGGRAHLGQLLYRDHIAQIVALFAAVLFGEGNAQHSIVRHLLDALLGKSLVLVDLFRKRLDLLLRKLAVHLLNHFVFIVEAEIHVVSFPSFDVLSTESRFCAPVLGIIDNASS